MLAVIAGAVLSVLIVVKVLDIGFFTAFDRPFRPVDDSSYAGIGVETLRDATGKSTADLAVVGAAVLLLALLAIPVLALLRVTRVAAGNRGWALRAAAVLGVLWVILRVAGAPVASSSAAALAVDEVQSVQADLHDRSVLARQLAHDRFRDTPGNQLLTGLRGKDVLLVFVESYGRSAVQGSSFSPRIDRVLDQGRQQLHAAGFDARSAFLTSPTFGGLSWLAHSTMQSGIKVTGQRRYNQLVDNGRLTLTRAFKRAGWRAVGAMPANHRAWPAGKSFYGYDAVYDRRNVGYRGPDFGLPPMPDQYALAALPARRARRAPPPAAVRRGRPHLEPRAVDEDPAADPLEPGRRRLGLRPHPARRTRGTASARPTGARSSTRCARCSRSCAATATTRRCSSCSATTSPPRSSPATTPTTTCRSRSSPTTRRCSARSAAGAGRTGCCRARRRPVWQMDSFRDRFLTAFR